MPPKIHAIVFDAVGTLIHAEPSVVSVYAAIGRRHGSQLEDSAVASRFKAAFGRQEIIDRDNDWTTSEARELQRWRDIVAEVFGDNELCFADLYEHFARPEAWRVDAAAGDLIASLRRRGLIGATASNLDVRLHRIVARLPALRELNDVIISSEVGTRKPGRAFFRAIETRLNIPANEIAFVGDDPINDAQGAADAGMLSILLGRDVMELSEIERFIPRPV